MYAELSGPKAAFLKPSDIKAFSPKLALQLDRESSAPLSATYWFLCPIANTDTTWAIASFDTLTWEFSYAGLYTDSGSKCKLFTLV